jgi:Family of unknown function (DUF5662)
VSYDSAPETLEHIANVRALLNRCAVILLDRGEVHDQSKLEPPEKEAFDQLTPRLAELEYGTQEYLDAAAELGPALEHHYEHNAHHPEHTSRPGLSGMSLLDMVEMLCDWKAASLRMKQRADGDEYLKRSFAEGLIYNQQRWGYTDEVATILWNTALELGFLDPEPDHFEGSIGANIAGGRLDSGPVGWECNGRCSKGAPDIDCPKHGKGGRA